MIKRIFTEKIYTSIALIVLFHIIGLGGFINEPLVDIFKKLVPFHLLLMLLLVLWNNTSWNKHYIGFSIFVFFFSFFIEVLGTNTGLIFGKFSYGDALGPKLWETPIIIGVNWFLLVMGVGSALSYLPIRNNIFAASVGASALTILDLIVEPVAIKFDYWLWYIGYIPLQNYLAWWVLSFIFILIFRRLHFNKQNIVAVFLLLIQFVFFILLNLL